MILVTHDSLGWDSFYKNLGYGIPGSHISVPVLSDPTGYKIAKIFEPLALQQQKNYDVSDANVIQQLEHHFG